MVGFTGKPDLTTAAPIDNDGFWPAMSMGDLMSKYRIPSEYDDSTIETGLMLGMIRVNEDLARVKDQVQQIEGFATFADYLNSNSTPFAGAELLQVFYDHAVYSRAKAHLLQDFKTINRREIAENEAKESEQTEKYWLDESAGSIASLMKHFFPDESFNSTSGLHVALI